MVANYSDGKQPATSKKTTTARKSSRKESKTGFSIPRLSSAISIHSSQTGTPTAIRAWLTSLPPDSPASRFPSPESGSERTTPAICGLKPSMSFAEYDPATHCWRTFQGLLVDSRSLYTKLLIQVESIVKKNGKTFIKTREFPTTSLPISDEYSETWPKQGMMRDGVCSELTTLVLPTVGRGSGYWPTPDTMNGLPLKSQETMDRESQTTRKGRRTASNLRDEVAVKEGVRMWHTPNVCGGGNPPGILERKGNHFVRPSGVKAHLGLDQAVQIYPTPTANDAKNDGGPSQFKRHSPPLNAFAKMLPTPRAEGSESCGAHHGKPDTLTAYNRMFPTPHAICGNGTGNHGTGGPNLQSVVGGKLNPQWVDWLMGWPIDATALEPMATDRFQSQWRLLQASFSRVLESIFKG